MQLPGICPGPVHGSGLHGPGGPDEEEPAEEEGVDVDATALALEALAALDPDAAKDVAMGALLLEDAALLLEDTALLLEDTALLLEDAALLAGALELPVLVDCGNAPSEDDLAEVPVEAAALLAWDDPGLDAPDVRADVPPLPELPPVTPAAPQRPDTTSHTRSEGQGLPGHRYPHVPLA